MDEQRIEQLGNVIKSNSWIKCYSNCEAEVEWATGNESQEPESAEE